MADGPTRGYFQSFQIWTVWYSLLRCFYRRHCRGRVLAIRTIQGQVFLLAWTKYEDGELVPLFVFPCFAQMDTLNYPELNSREQSQVKLTHKKTGLIERKSNGAWKKSNKWTELFECLSCVVLLSNYISLFNLCFPLFFFCSWKKYNLFTTYFLCCNSMPQAP